MKKVIKKIRLNNLTSVAVAIGLGIFVLFISSKLGTFVTSEIKNYTDLNFYTSNTVMKFFMLIFSVILILIVNKGSLKDYGFNKPDKLKYIRFFLITLGILIAAFVLGNILFNGVLRHLFPVENPKGFPKVGSIVELILTVWIWSTICEEVLTRGLMQSFMKYQTNLKFLRLSLPVWVSGIFFGMMHLSLLKMDMDIWVVSFIVFNTTTIGLLAAYYREKTNSIYPAIFIHFLANVVGSLPAIIMGVL
ncbi:MAG: CPBP family intramembrane metalloprotease [Bacteroidales bacterium]|nr:CPBP family intramembrane metalloprotease [Bacteroidales bacterium]